MDDKLKQAAIELYDRFTHEGLDRRLFMARMVALAGSVAAAEALIGAIASSPAAAAIALRRLCAPRSGGRTAVPSISITPTPSASTSHRAGRTSQWLKIKAEQTSDFVIVGFTRPEGTRNHFGALQLADHLLAVVDLRHVGELGQVEP